MINSILQGAQEADFITSYKLIKASNDLYYFEFDIDCPMGIVSSYIMCNNEGYQIKSRLFTDIFETETDTLKMLKVDKNNKAIMYELSKLICWIAQETNVGRFGIIFKTGVVMHTFPVFCINRPPSDDTIVQSIFEVKRIFSSVLIEAIRDVIGGIRSAEEAYDKYHLEVFNMYENIKKAE